jgi:hypothetical protein
MGAPFDELTAGRRAFVARASLSELTALVGQPGRVAVAARADLLAQVDQHVAAIRDALGNQLVEPVALAGYAAALRDAARFTGDTLETWDAPTWMMVRLLAVCVLSGN